VKDVPQKTFAKLSRSLKAAQAEFRAVIDALAEEARAEILPYFKTHDLDYTAGNGTWVITRSGEGSLLDRMLYDAQLPKNIRELLHLEVALNDPLGLYFRDIKREDR
jgi:hypothetical protein